MQGAIQCLKTGKLLNKTQGGFMKDLNSNTEKRQDLLSVNQLNNFSLVEKFHGNMSDEKLGCTILINETIHKISQIDLSALGLHTFICSLPSSFQVNTSYLKKHFKIGKEKLAKCLKILTEEGLIQSISIRNEGKFFRNIYTSSLKTRQEFSENIQLEQHLSPQAVFPPPANPPLINHINNKNYIKEFSLIGNSQPPISPPKNQTFSSHNLHSSELTSDKTQSQQCTLQHMQANAYNCSTDVLEAYLKHRGKTLTMRVWDISIRIYLDKCAKHGISANDGLLKLLENKVGSTDFDTVFSDMKTQLNIQAFEKEAEKYELARGQSLESAIADLKKIGDSHGLSADFDYASYLNKSHKTENTHMHQSFSANPLAFSTDEDEPEYRRNKPSEISIETQKFLDSRRINKTAPKIDSKTDTNDCAENVLKSLKEAVLFATRASNTQSLKAQHKKDDVLMFSSNHESSENFGPPVLLLNNTLIAV